VNVAPSTSYPRAARRTSCLGTFVLVLVLWGFSVVALAAYLVTRSAIVRQVRFAWWAVFLAAVALLAVEVAAFEATGDGLVDLLRLHVHPWWLLANGYGMGSLLGWPLTIVACQAPLGIPTGAMAGALGVARGSGWLPGPSGAPTANAKPWSPRSTPPATSPKRPAVTANQPTRLRLRRWGWPIRAATCTCGCASAAAASRSSSPPGSSGWRWPCSASPAPARLHAAAACLDRRPGRHAGGVP
jgi:hypothetical protein